MKIRDLIPGNKYLHANLGVVTLKSVLNDVDPRMCFCDFLDQNGAYGRISGLGEVESQLTEYDEEAELERDAREFYGRFRRAMPDDGRDEQPVWEKLDDKLKGAFKAALRGKP
jgi:hypothetical protein